MKRKCSNKDKPKKRAKKNKPSTYVCAGTCYGFEPVDFEKLKPCVADKVYGIVMKRLDDFNQFQVSSPVTHVYNTIDHARNGFREYLRIACKQSCEVIFLGMNPGPFGMVQTGFPFGDVETIKEWFAVKSLNIQKPSKEHPKRPVVGLACKRKEISGKRLWGWAESEFGSPENFFKKFFVHNYCPLVFMETSGKNRVPSKLKKAEREVLIKICNDILVEVINLLDPVHVVGIGKFAHDRALEIKKLIPKIKVGKIIHPSPASPLANHWAQTAKEQLKELGII